MLFYPAAVQTVVGKNIGRLAKTICIYVVFIAAMMNELIKIQQDMGAPQQQHRPQQAAVHHKDEADISADPNDWVADLPKFGIYHSEYTTKQWLHVFRPL